MKTPDMIKMGLRCFAWDDVECCDCIYRLPETEECMQQVAMDALAYIQQLESAQPKWISVEERLPGSEDERCLVFTPDEKESEIAYYCGDGEWVSPDCKMMTSAVTHWMPLPSAPKEEA